MQTIQTHKGELIVVSVPMDAYGFEIGYDFESGKLSVSYHFQKTGNKFEDLSRKETEISVTNWVPHSITIIGTSTKGQLDFDAAPYVIKDGHRGYKSSIESVGGFFLARDAFKSMLTSHKVEYANTKLVFLKREK